MLFQKYVTMVHNVATGWEASVSSPAKYEWNVQSAESG